MKQFNEMDHIEMLEREVVYWKGQMQNAGEELAKALPRLTIFENATVKNLEKITNLKKDLRDRGEENADLKLQLMDKNDKHSKEMKELYGKLNQYQKQWETATATAKQERELKKHYSQKLDLSNHKINEWTEFAAELEDILMTTKRRERHILRAFNDKSKEVTDLKKRVRQLERERDGLLESVNMLSSHAMEKMEKAVLSKENFESANKDIMYSAKPNEIPHALQKIEKLYKTDFKIYDISSSGELWSGFKRVVFYTTDTPNVSALRERIEKEYVSFFPQQEIEHTGTIVHDNPLFVFEKMSQGKVMNETIDKDMMIYRNAIILGSGFVYEGQPLRLFTIESLGGE